ncbi:hypothetical protein, partial [Micromonospora sp. U21]|uniref:hypothetical protein n=1 Tax=Micromonospora sp. U21 TaxID=2824899 RepID=UPI001B361F1A
MESASVALGRAAASGVRHAAALRLRRDLRVGQGQVHGSAARCAVDHARRCPLILEVELEGARLDAVDELADIVGLP